MRTDSYQFSVSESQHLKMHFTSCSLSAFGMRWYISTGEIFIHMCLWKERQGKGILFTTQEILKKDDKTEEDIFSEGNSCLYENFNCYQNFNAVARKGS